MSEIERRTEATPAEHTPDFHAPSKLDEWVLVVRDVSRLASQISDTEFVPDSMRGNPAAVTAAILSGREAGVGPMTALQHIHLVKGKPGQSAQLMRQLVLAAGHQIRYIDTTDTRCVIEGRRRGEERWERVEFTADQAKKANINLGGYPADKLVARATTRLCRRLFADAIGGTAYSTEELEDGDTAALEATTQPEEPAAEPPPAKRTAKRSTPTRARTKRAEPEPEPAAAEAGPPEPPLPGEDDTSSTDAEQPTLDVADGNDAAITRAQQEKLFAQLGELNAGDDRATRLTTLGLLVQRTLGSSSDLTRDEASGVIDLLERVLGSDDPQQALSAVLGELEQQDSTA